jgi:hypothetical protein
VRGQTPTRLPTENHFGQVLSTVRRQAGILVHVDSALLRNVDVSNNNSFLGLSRMDNLLKAHS